MWVEKLDAELELAQKKLEIENNARATTTKLPKLRITPFKGTPTDWVRFENMFVTQVHSKPISAEETFSYLLEMVTPTVRGKSKTWRNRLQNSVGKTEDRLRPKQAGGKRSRARNCKTSECERDPFP